MTRKPLDPAKASEIRTMLAEGSKPKAIAKSVGVALSTVYRYAREARTLSAPTRKAELRARSEDGWSAEMARTLDSGASLSVFTKIDASGALYLSIHETPDGRVAVDLHRDAVGGRA